MDSSAKEALASSRRQANVFCSNIWYVCIRACLACPLPAFFFPSRLATSRKGLRRGIYSKASGGLGCHERALFCASFSFTVAVIIIRLFFFFRAGSIGFVVLRFLSIFFFPPPFFYLLYIDGGGAHLGPSRLRPLVRSRRRLAAALPMADGAGRLVGARAGEAGGGGGGWGGGWVGGGGGGGGGGKRRSKGGFECVEAELNRSRPRERCVYICIDMWVWRDFWLLRFGGSGKTLAIEFCFVLFSLCRPVFSSLVSASFYLYKFNGVCLFFFGLAGVVAGKL